MYQKFITLDVSSDPVVSGIIDGDPFSDNWSALSKDKCSKFITMIAEDGKPTATFRANSDTNFDVTVNGVDVKTTNSYSGVRPPGY